MTPDRTWITTFSGRRFYPLNPVLEDIQLVDIAHALSLICRYNGHCTTFYSVAEHSVRVSELLAYEEALWGLLHDAPEAYICDVVSPIKDQLPFYAEYEDRLMGAIAARFDLRWPIIDPLTHRRFPMPPAVDQADKLLLATELRDLTQTPSEFRALYYAPLEQRIHPWTSEKAEEAFLARFDTLQEGKC